MGIGGFDQEYLDDLKKETHSAPMILNSENLRIVILHRGEYLFYFDKQKNKSTVIEIGIKSASLYKKSIRRWDNEEKIIDKEVEAIITDLKVYFKQFQKRNLQIVN